MKRLLAVFLIALLSLSLFTACNGDDKKQTEAPVNDEVKNTLAYTTFRWGVTDEKKFRSNASSSTASTDAMEKRYSDLQSEYNMEFVIEAIENNPDELTKRILLGRDIWDLVWGTPRKLGYTAYTYTSEEGGILLALKDIPTIDPEDEKWGAKAFIVPAMFGGIQYGFYPWSWDMIPTCYGCLLFNNGLIKEYRLSDPHELFEQDQWTWANFQSMLDAYAKGYGEDCIPWITASLNDDVFNMQFTNGNQLVMKGTDGKLSWGWDGQSGIEALQFMVDLRNAGLYNSGDVHNCFAVIFSSLFCTSSSGGATNVAVGASGKVPIATAVKDLGIITMPHGPSGSKENVSANVYWTNDYNFVLNNSENIPEAIGYVIDYVFAPLEGRSNWREYADEMIFHRNENGDPVNLNAYLYMLEHLNYDYSVQLRTTASAIDEYGKQAAMGSISISSFFESCRQRINNDISTNLTIEEYEKINEARSGK